MQYSSVILIAAIAATSVLSHGVVTEVQGANGVNLPGLSVIDGTPRDCATPKCGAEADTSIIRKNSASPLGKSEGGGPVTADRIVGIFMGGNASSTAAVAAREVHAAMLARRSLAVRASNGGTKSLQGNVETGVAASEGAGASSGLPTCSDSGLVTMNFFQVNQDGAGPLTAMVDGTSGGTSAAAFQKATVQQNVPGSSFGGLSPTTTTDFPVTVQMPAGMTCAGTVAGVQNVCVVKVQNSALAGPFGGSCVFTQSAAAKKRAIEYNLKKRNFARALVDSE